MDTNDQLIGFVNAISPYIEIVIDYVSCCSNNNRTNNKQEEIE
jgi:hypothetical protein